ncbi:EAL domain-containing response regulator [Thauera aromatica]|uniref:Diguanylate cyclase n=1 Tax=Thauera aromatica K172 TaxID=44139 RepID=A0A2R4BLW2_THAAR|nr:EAL domain-containing response regulator [Thauera aromatica]AVR88315.1 diguanylate cyclase [Thauera aromatica K172]
MRILVVDDDPFICRLMSRQLHTLGFAQIELCERARAAVERLEHEPDTPGLIFCDLQMPEMDGVEFIRHLVRLGYRGALVLVSGEDERILQSAERLARAHQLQVAGTLYKPVSSRQLQHLLQALPNPRQERTSPTPPYGAEALAHGIAAGQLVNHYQPKVDMHSGAVVGVETLVRWQHPEDGLIYPDRFITTAEDHGLIDALMRAVLRCALDDARRWERQGHALQLAVNVSMDNLVRLDFPEFVEEEAARAGVAPGTLIFEVTESHLMKNREAALDILTRLRLKRVGLSIDDFGTGHSSLTQLRDIPFTELKIDRSFVHGAWRDGALRTILDASLEMARKLGMKTVAEGIEDHDDWNHLRAAGCDVAQGWFIARALPVEQLLTWLHDREVGRASFNPAHHLY